MARADQFEPGDIYDFMTHASALLGTFKGVRVIGTVTHEGVRGYIDPAASHAAVYGTLPEGIPDNYKQYNYLVITQPNGNTTALGLPWIDENSVHKKEFGEANARIINVSVEDRDKIRNALTSNGFQVANIVFD